LPNKIQKEKDKKKKKDTLLLLSAPSGAGRKSDIYTFGANL
jgi:hypothetical protein